MLELVELLILPFTYGFMQKAFLMSIIIAIPMSILSCYLVLRGWSLMGDAISHAVLPGIVIAYISQIALAIGAFVAGVCCALLSGYVKANTRIKQDSVLGIVFSGMFALGLVLYLKIETEIHLDHILFGNILGLSWSDVLNSFILSGICTLFVLAKRLDLLVNIFDTQHAKAIGLNVSKLNYIFLAVLSLAIVSSIESSGIILGIAMLIIPGAVSFLLSKDFIKMLTYSVVISVLCSIFGVYSSFFLDSAPAPTIVLIMTIVFIVSFFKQTSKSKF
jgi:manganese/iron transport system permease protein|tara:strand:+ start:3794 stop:4621 length:828 start_codon:yes stop_codon:yes gene_type:complete